MGYLSVFKILFLFLFFFSLSGEQMFGQPIFSQEGHFDDSTQVERLNEQAWQYKNSEPDIARERALVAVQLAEKIGYPKGAADGYHNLGMVQWRYGDQAGALKFYLRALEIRFQIRDSLGLGRSYNNIGNVYYAQAKYGSARVYYERGRQIRLALNDNSGLVYSLSNLGDVALQYYRLEQAREYYSASEALVRKENNPVALAHVLGRLGNLALLLGNNENAKKYWKEAIAFAEITDDRRLLATCLQELVRVMMVDQKQVTPEQETYARRSLTLATEASALDLQAEAALLLAQLLALKGDFQQVYHYQEDYRQLTKLLLERSKKEAVDAVNRNYAEERKTAQKLLEEKEASAVLTEKNNRLTFLMLILGLVLLTVLVVSFFMAYRKQHNQAKELEAKNEELAARYSDLRGFARIASHDLKEPLRNIGSFTNLLQRRYGEVFDQNGKEYLAFIIKGAKTMNELLNDLLSLASINELSQSGMEPIVLEPLVRKIFHEQARLLGIEAEITLFKLPEVNGNYKLIEMLFERLFQNALKFRGEHKPSIQVNFYLDGNYNVFTITDNGIGIEEAYHKQIFNAFQRLDRQQFEGTGIGLAICRRIVEEHRGKIWVESKVGEGTTVFVSLPIW